jgi:hypothetical protein
MLIQTTQGPDEQLAAPPVSQQVGRRVQYCSTSNSRTCDRPRPKTPSRPAVSQSGFQLHHCPPDAPIATHADLVGNVLGMVYEYSKSVMNPKSIWSC